MISPYESRASTLRTGTSADEAVEPQKPERVVAVLGVRVDRLRPESDRQVRVCLAPCGTLRGAVPGGLHGPSGDLGGDGLGHALGSAPAAALERKNTRMNSSYS